MATDVAPPTTGSVTTPRPVHRRRGLLLLAAAAFNLWLWATRIRNLIADAGGFDTAFVAVHGVLYVAAIGVAVVVGAIGWRLWREGRRPVEPRA